MCNLLSFGLAVGLSSVIGLLNYSFIEKGECSLENVEIKLKSYIDCPFSKELKEIKTVNGKKVAEFYEGDDKTDILIFEEIGDEVNVIASSDGSFDYYEFLNSSSLLNSSYQNILDDYKMYNATYNTDLVNPSKYFTIENISSHLYLYVSTYLQETRITDVPNYLNLQFPETNDDGTITYSGCVPTTAAMYFAYLSNNGYSSLNDNRYLPLNFYDAESSINSFILYLGNNYFYTTGAGGTSYANKINGFNNYLSVKGFSNYTCHNGVDFSEFYNSVANCGLPVPTTIYTNHTLHSLLGIGVKIYNANTNNPERFIICNYASSTSLSVVNVSVKEVVYYTFIHQ